MRLPIILIILSIYNTAQAQLSGPSLFKETKSANPAVIALRKERVLSIVAKTDKVLKEQDLSKSYTGMKVISAVDVLNTSLFYGGNGGGLTTELIVNSSSGERVTIVKDATENTSYETEISSNILFYSLGFSKFFGISFGMAESSFGEEYNANVGSYTFSNKYSSDASTKIIRLGSIYNFGMDFGFYFEQATTSGDGTNNGETESFSNSFSRYGLSLGTSSSNHHFELSIEKDLPAEAKPEVEVYRISFTAEIGFSKIALGYTGRLIAGGYSDFENSIYNNLVYSDFTENRLEHLINFSFGRSKGHSISGSIFSSITKTDSKPIVKGEDLEYPTTIGEQGLSLKYTYSF